MSDLRHWHARTTSATSSSTSATRRVAAAEELLRDLWKLDPLGLCPLSRCILLLPGRSLSFTCVTPRLLAPGLALSLARLTLQQAWRLPVRPLPWLGPVEASKPARRIALQIHALRRCAESTSGRHQCYIWRPCRACTSCPADRCLLAATCCTLSCAKAHHGSVGCSGARACILVSARFTCSLATAGLRLESSCSWLLRPCWLPELRPCSLHT